MTSSTGQSGNRSAGGFTLLELILVLVLISTVLAIAAPSLRGFARGRKVHDAAAHMLAVARMASAQAVAEARVYRLNFDAAEGAYWLTARRGGVFEELGTEFGRRFELPEAVGFELHGTPLEEDELYIDFHPDGSSDEATILLVDLDGRTVELGSRAVSERFAILTQPEGVR